jgi:hypothetical protein
LAVSLQRYAHKSNHALVLSATPSMRFSILRRLMPKGHWG